MNLLQLNDVTVREGRKIVLHNLSIAMQSGEQWAVTGPSGSGKTTLLHALAGLHAHAGSITISPSGENAHAKIVLIEQQHRFRSLSHTSNFYYQQRYNSMDAEDAVTVQEYLQQHISAFEQSPTKGFETVAGMLAILHLHELLPVRLIQLSNGENKRLQIAKALLLQPAVLLLDNPFTGLDAEARATLVHLLQHLAGKGIHLIMTTASQQVPAFITHVLTLEKNGHHYTENIQAYRLRQSAIVHETGYVPNETLLQTLTGNAPADDFTFAVRMNSVNIRYNNRMILDNINWEIRKGEHWALSGPNGAGKSTLLSLINADNPQAYAN